MAEIDFYDTPDREMQAIAGLFARYASHFGAFHSILSIAASEYKFVSATHFDDEHNFRIRIAGDCIRVKLSILRSGSRHAVGAISALTEDNDARATLYMDKDGNLLSSPEGLAIEKNGKALAIASEYVVHNFILKCIEQAG